MSTQVDRTLRRLGQSALGLLVRHWATLVVLAGLPLLGTGLLNPAQWQSQAAQTPLQLVAGAVGLLGLLTVLVLRGQKLWQGLVPQGQQAMAQLELGGALLIVSYATLQLLGGADSPLAPLRYAVCAVLISLYRQRRALVMAVLALLCEGLLLYAAGQTAVQQYLLSAAVVSVFASLHFAVLRGELWRQREDYKRRVDGAIAAMQRQARDFRLLLPKSQQSRPAGALTEVSGELAPLTRDRQDEEALLLRSAVVMVRQNLDTLVDLLKRALTLHTCAILWLPEGASQLDVVAASTDSDAMSDKPIGLDLGVIGTIVKNQQALRMPSPKATQVPYYKLPRHGELPPLGAFLGVPLIEEGRLCGVLCADRLQLTNIDPARAETADAPDAVAFSAAEEALLLSAVPLILRGLESERVFAAVERSQYEHERLYIASQLLSRALTPEEVHRTAFRAVREICNFDFAALTLYDESTGRHTVVAAAGEPNLSHTVLERQFPDNAGLCAMVVKNRTALPKGGELRDREATIQIFDEHVRITGFDSLLVLPLLFGELQGTLVVASRTANLFRGHKDRQHILHVLANQIAGSLDNARMYRELEAMATTDGLTGLTNRRAFQERLTEMLGRAERHGRPLTLLLCDIDHFKKINDTYGHPVGDTVLKRVAQVVAAQVRKIDIAARYGGEEFAVVLESTDQEGGRQLAERIRQEVQKLVLAQEQGGGTFGCTLSLGISTFPSDGQDGRLLIQRADQALYYAKRNGRNRAVAFGEVAAEIKTAA